tara:strand:+ start:495 stop:1169 length:675 start_codon:yes stop_codon:yes gene_type:complete
MADNQPQTIIDRMKLDEQRRLARVRELGSVPLQSLSDAEQEEYKRLFHGVSGDLQRGLSDEDLERGRFADKLTQSTKDPEGHEISHRAGTYLGPKGPDGRPLNEQPQEVQDRYYLALADEMLKVDSLPVMMERYGLNPEKASDQAVGEAWRRYHTEPNPESKLRVAQELAKAHAGDRPDGDEPQKLNEEDPENVFTGEGIRQDYRGGISGPEKEAKGTVIHKRN